MVLARGDAFGAVSQILSSGAKVVERSGCLLDGQKHGTWQARGADGELLIEADYVHGLRHGRWIRWHGEGRPAIEARYVQGHLEGELQVWYPNGTLAMKVHFRQGVLDGPVLVMHSSGEPWVEGQFDQGRPVGEWKRRSRSGKVRARRFREVMDGLEFELTAAK